MGMKKKKTGIPVIRDISRALREPKKLTVLPTTEMKLDPFDISPSGIEIQLSDFASPVLAVGRGSAKQPVSLVRFEPKIVQFDPNLNSFQMLGEYTSRFSYIAWILPVCHFWSVGR